VAVSERRAGAARAGEARSIPARDGSAAVAITRSTSPWVLIGRGDVVLSPRIEVSTRTSSLRLN